MNINKLERIRTDKDLRTDEKYYQDNYKRTGNRHLEWTTLYDKDFNVTRNVTVDFTDSLKNLIEIVSVERQDERVLMAYRLEKLNDSFLKKIRTEDTGADLEDMCKAVKPKNWI